MRPKKRYLLVHHRGSERVLKLIRARYAEKFGSDEVERASLAVISYEDGFFIMRCRLEHCKHLLETLSSMRDKFVPLNMSGTLRALRSRKEAVRKRFLASGE
ncbi:MAG: Rpp14/Pop5 family protein [Nitrososphaerales archaeon]